MKFKLDVDLTSNNAVINIYTKIAINIAIFLFLFGWLIPVLISTKGLGFILGLFVLLASPIIFYKLNPKEIDPFLARVFPNLFGNGDNNEKSNTNESDTNTSTRGSDSYFK